MQPWSNCCELAKAHFGSHGSAALFTGSIRQYFASEACVRIDLRSCHAQLVLPALRVGGTLTCLGSDVVYSMRVLMTVRGHRTMAATARDKPAPMVQHHTEPTCSTTQNHQQEAQGSLRHKLCCFVNVFIIGPPYDSRMPGISSATCTPLGLMQDSHNKGAGQSMTCQKNWCYARETTSYNNDQNQVPSPTATDKLCKKWPKRCLHTCAITPWQVHALKRMK